MENYWKDLQPYSLRCTVISWIMVTNGANKCIIKWEIKFEDYKICLENNKTILRSSKDNKRKKTPNGVTSCPCGTGAGRVCKVELIENTKKKYKNLV